MYSSGFQYVAFQEFHVQGPSKYCTVICLEASDGRKVEREFHIENGGENRDHWNNVLMSRT